MNDLKISGNIDNVNRYTMDTGISENNYKKSETKRKSPIISENNKFENAFNKVKQYVEIFDTRLSFTYDKENKEPVIFVVDNKTNEVIRRIPSEKMVEISGDVEKMKGLFIQKDA